MIKRNIDTYLESFYNTENKALLITGARQIGKTFSIRQFGRTHFKHLAEINFIEHPEARAVFETVNGHNDILLRLSAYLNDPLVKGETLIFLDEVQECPEIITAIKFLVEEGSFRYILSGSLLGADLKDIKSVPVGYMAIKEMFPIDFEEFVRAQGVRDDVINNLQMCWNTMTPVDDMIHRKMMELFRLYLIVGGMPAAVQTYIDTNNLQRVMEQQQHILTLYRKDIAKYDYANKLYIQEIFDLIPPELNNPNKRFILKHLNENLKFARYENSFLWLKDAGVALPVYNVEEPTSPLLLARSRNLFKLFQNDIGLLSCQYANGIQLRIITGDDIINYGSIYENVVAQELKAHGFTLYYFNSKKQGELDFLIERGNSVIPIEVKSGKNYERHHALTTVMQNRNYRIDEAYVLCNENISQKARVLYVPIYMTMFLRQNQMAPISYKIDLTGL